MILCVLPLVLVPDPLRFYPSQDDKQCKKKLGDATKGETVDGKCVIKTTWKLKHDSPQATVFFKVIEKDVDGNKFVSFGDSTLSRMVDGKPMYPKYLEISPITAITDGMVAGVIIMSAFAWGLLIIYFLADTFMKKNK